jgi:ABC-2 type transport system ATP-binding protein
MDTSPTIITTSLTKRFGSFTAVDDISLNIRRGDIYGFLGLNGAGKTTTIRMLLGMIRPHAGSISLFGEKVQPGRHTIWQRVGYLVETPHHYPDLTIRENLEIFRRLRCIEDSDAVKNIISELGLTPYAHRRAKTLSLGNSQRLGLAKALIHRPDLLILDEPANALDPAGIVEIRNLLRRLSENDGVTIFISSHILSEIARLATRIGVVHNGKLIKELFAKEIEEQEEQHLAVDVGDPSAALVALKNAGIVAGINGNNTLTIEDTLAIEHPDRIAKLLVEAGCPPARLVVERTDLESYFLKLVGMKQEINQ